MTAPEVLPKWHSVVTIRSQSHSLPTGLGQQWVARAKTSQVEGKGCSLRGMERMNHVHIHSSPPQPQSLSLLCSGALERVWRTEPRFLGTYWHFEQDKSLLQAAFLSISGSSTPSCNWNNQKCFHTCPGGTITWVEIHWGGQSTNLLS